VTKAIGQETDRKFLVYLKCILSSGISPQQNRGRGEGRVLKSEIPTLVATSTPTSAPVEKKPIMEFE
jgi:hypothetical protein